MGLVTTIVHRRISKEFNQRSYYTVSRSRCSSGQEIAPSLRALAFFCVCSGHLMQICILTRNGWIVGIEALNTEFLFCKLSNTEVKNGITLLLLFQEEGARGDRHGRHGLRSPGPCIRCSEQQEIKSIMAKRMLNFPRIFKSICWNSTTVGCSVGSLGGRMRAKMVSLRLKIAARVAHRPNHRSSCHINQ